MQNASLFFETMKIWVLSDGKQGHLNQSMGVAEALALDSAQIKVITFEKRRFGSFLSFFWPPLKVKSLPKGPFPHVVIGTGNLTVPVSKWVKMQSPGTTTVQMMAPLNRFGLKFKPGSFLDHVFNHENLNFFDVVASPVHENMKESDQVVVTLGAPNRITKLRLKEAQMKWFKTFAAYKGKKVAVLVGGNSKRFTFDEAAVEKFTADLQMLAKEHKVSLLMTTSRRTGKKAENLLKGYFSKEHFIWNGEGDNPYMGMLACADAIVTTPDSVSMVSEAASSGKPVYIWGLDDDMTLPNMGKFNTFYKALYKNNFIQPYKNIMQGRFPVVQHPLDDTSKISGFVRAHVLKRLNNS